MNLLELLCFSLCLCITCTLAHPDGAPCGAIKPNHPGGPSGIAPYEITLDVHESGCYPANRPVVVTLRGKDAASMKGFVLGGYTVDSNENVGVFAYPQDASPYQYHCEKGNKVTHSRLTHKDNADKKSISVYWRWDNPDKPFRFIATVVRSYSNWYESEVKSVVLNPCFAGADSLRSKHGTKKVLEPLPAVPVANPVANAPAAPNAPSPNANSPYAPSPSQSSHNAPSISQSSHNAPSISQSSHNAPTPRQSSPSAPGVSRGETKSQVEDKPEAKESKAVETELLVSSSNSCVLAKDAGHPHCEKGGWTWRYHWQTPYCFPFWYGGCGGNENNFETWEDCHNKCHRMAILQRTLLQKGYTNIRNRINV